MTLNLINFVMNRAVAGRYKSVQIEMDTGSEKHQPTRSQHSPLCNMRYLRKLANRICSAPCRFRSPGMINDRYKLVNEF